MTIALNEKREAVAMMAVGLSDTQQNELDALLESYEPQEVQNRIEDAEAEDEAGVEESSPDEAALALDDETDSVTSEE